MLGLQETRPSGTPSTKTYSCVACSATFHGLSSLLVHQASHANEISRQPVTALPTCVHCGGLFASKELLEKHHCMVLPPPVSQDVYISDCVEEFQEFSTNQKHKNSPDMEMQVDEESGETATDTANKKTTEAEPEYNRSTPVEISSHLNSYSLSTEELQDVQKSCTDSEANKTNFMMSSDISPVNNNKSQEQHYDRGKSLDGTPSSDLAEDEDVESFEHEEDHFKSDIVTRCISDSEEPGQQSQEPKPNNKKTLLKVLASAYMNRRQPAQIKWGQSKRSLPSQKVVPRPPMQASAVMATSNPRYRVSHLRLKIAKYGSNKEGFMPTGSMLQLKLTNLPKKGSIVSVTKALCPVVMLETRQKLVKDNVEGRHQCGFCRRVFQDRDSLIMHHVLHRKERVKFCRRCQQLVISVIAVPDNHVCSQSNAESPKHFPLVRKLITIANNPQTAFLRKLFHCQLCNRSYTRRHNLNKHNCQWITSLKPSHSEAAKDKLTSFVGGFNAEKRVVSATQRLASQVSVGVNTGNTELIKEEDLSYESTLQEQHHLELMKKTLKSEAHLGSPKSFPPFALQRSEDAKLDKPSDKTDASDSVGAGQWTVPLDDSEIDVLLEADDESPEGGEDSRENSDEDVVILEPPLTSKAASTFSSKDYKIQVSDSGIKRFSCNRCQRSYSRRFTLNNHLNICGARKLMLQHSFGKVSTNSLCSNKNVPCPVCGKVFTRKDNMKIHYKRCQSMRSKATVEENRGLEKQTQASNENVFVLPPPKNQDKNENKSTAGSGGGGSWGIMSLPSVLPRKVTCECGAAFTCPRLLFEHLQMHAMESYICSHCGESLQSWAEFERHQKLHMEPATQKIGQNEPHQQQFHIQPQQKCHFPSAEQKRPQDLLKSRRRREPCVCPRCKKVFSERKSLLRHLRLSCRGETGVEKKNSCSRCGIVFQNTLALKVHVQSNGCTPTFKPIRCPVCVRWFSCLEGLKRHLVLHSQQKLLACQICGHNFPNQQALLEHKKNVHDSIKVSSPRVQSANAVQSSQSFAFHCQICQRNYPKLQSLKDHLRKVHRKQGQKPAGMFEAKVEALQSQYGSMQQSPTVFHCHICSRNFPDISSLKNHKSQVHSILGGEAFKGIVELNTFSHFQCQICSRSYPNKRSLRNHRRRVHHIRSGLDTSKGIIHQNQDNIYKCQICHRIYSGLKSLKNHRRRVHRIFGGVFEATKLAPADTMQSQSELFHVSAPSEPSEALTVAR